MNNGYR